MSELSLISMVVRSESDTLNLSPIGWSSVRWYRRRLRSLSRGAQFWRGARPSSSLKTLFRHWRRWMRHWSSCRICFSARNFESSSAMVRESWWPLSPRSWMRTSLSSSLCLRSRFLISSRALRAKVSVIFSRIWSTQ